MARDAVGILIKIQKNLCILKKLDSNKESKIGGILKKGNSYQLGLLSRKKEGMLGDKLTVIPTE